MLAGSLTIGVGDRLASYARNHVLLLILHHACARLGILYVPLNWRLSEAEIAARNADCTPALLVHDDGLDRGCRDLAPDALDAMWRRRSRWRPKRSTGAVPR